MIKTVVYETHQVRVQIEDPREHMQRYWDWGIFYESHSSLLTEFFVPNPTQNNGSGAIDWRKLKFFGGRLLSQIRDGGKNQGGMLDYVAKHYKGGGFIDVGSAIGNHSLFFAVVCEADQVLSFEPIAELAAQHRRNIELNALNTMVVYDVALGKYRGLAAIEKADMHRNAGTSRIKDQGIPIAMDTLDNLLAEVDTPGITLIKIDVEGYSLPVLEGAAKTLNQFHPDLFVECGTRTELQEVQSYLCTRGYQREPGVFNRTPTYLFKAKPL